MHEKPKRTHPGQKVARTFVLDELFQSQRLRLHHAHLAFFRDCWPIRVRQPRQELQEHHPEAEDVRRRRVADSRHVAREELRGEVPRRAGEGVVPDFVERLCAVVADEREAEIRVCHVALGRDHDVVGLDVAVHDAGVVEFFKAVYLWITSR